MTDTIRDLLISLSSHMAYMQGQLEARHELDDPEDYYWYRESVLLQQKVTDALADEPAVPEGREPASVTGQPSDDELLRLYGVATPCHTVHEWERELNFARAVLARWGNPAPQPPAEGEVAELVADLQECADSCTYANKPYWAAPMRRAAELLQRLSPPQPVPVPVSEPAPGQEVEG